MFCDWLSEQLAPQEKKQMKKKLGRLNSDGLLKLLSADKFYNKVLDHQKATEEEKSACENCLKERKSKQTIMAAWRDVEDAWKVWNNAWKDAFHEEMDAWKKEKTLAKESWLVGQKKPKLGKLEKSAPKPVVEVSKSHGQEADDGNSNDGESTDNDC
ncbi:hypothetical protein ID866_7857 [Astraeus odoratus]|nr:hypothetical protein ID866_7857 [Astraeus odoratus]